MVHLLDIDIVELLSLAHSNAMQQTDTSISMLKWI
jgi:hypothetical protein